MGRINCAEAHSLLPPVPCSPPSPISRWIRGEHFRYKFSTPGSPSAAQGKWWIRKRLGPYFPPVDLAGLRKYFSSRGWPHPDIN